MKPFAVWRLAAVACLLVALVAPFHAIAAAPPSPPWTFLFQRTADIQGLSRDSTGTIWLEERDVTSLRRGRIVAVASDGSTRVFPLPHKWRGPRRHRYSTGSPIEYQAPNPVVEASGAVWYLNPIAGTLGRINNGVQQEYPLPVVPATFTRAANGRDFWLVGFTITRPKVGEDHWLALRISPTGKVLSKSAIYPRSQDFGAWGCDSAVLGPGNHLWLGCGNQLRVVRPGRVARGYPPLKDPPRCGAATMHGLTRASDGQMWFVSPNSSCKRNDRGFAGRIDAAGRQPHRYMLASGQTPFYIVPGADGTLWISGNGPWLDSISSTGSISTYPVVPLAGVPGSSDAVIQVFAAGGSPVAAISTVAGQPTKVYALSSG